LAFWACISHPKNVETSSKLAWLAGKEANEGILIGESVLSRMYIL